MVNVSTYVGFLIFGLVVIAIFSITVNIFQEAPRPPEKNAFTRSIALGEFSISRLSRSTEVALPNMILINGLLFGANELKYNLSLPNETQDIKLSFDVVRTNRYGPLSVRADGFAESRKLPKGKYSFDLGKREGSTIITIQPESSWWRIWAPALYELNNTKATISAFYPETKEFSFLLDKELAEPQSASLVMQFDKDAGTFTASLNGNTIHSGGVSSIETIRINTTLLRKENSLVFSAATGSQFSGRGTFVINYKA